MLLLVQRAYAEDPLRAALFKTASEDTDLASLAASVDSVLLDELGSVPNLQIAARPALDLPSMQLAIDCVGETADCLSLAAKQAEADGLIAPQLRRMGDQVMLTVLFHDARGKLAIEAATRRYTGAGFEQKVLDGIPAMVRELFGLPEPAGLTPLAAAEASAPEPARPPPSAANKIPWLPIGIAAGGAVAIAVGAAFGAASGSAEDAYKKIVVTDTSSAGQATDKYETSSDLATIANVAFVLGGAALAAGAAIYLIESRKDADERRPPTPRAALSVRPGSVVMWGNWD
jgi:hypothetical protein